MDAGTTFAFPKLFGARDGWVAHQTLTAWRVPSHYCAPCANHTPRLFEATASDGAAYGHGSSAQVLETPSIGGNETPVARSNNLRASSPSNSSVSFKPNISLHLVIAVFPSS